MVRAFAGVLCMCVLASCQTAGVGALTQAQAPPPAAEPPKTRPKPELSAKVNGERVGNGPWRVALVLPRSAAGAARQVSEEMVRAARLAMRDVGAGRLQLVVKDTGGAPQRAAAAVEEAQREGASLVLGPLLSRTTAAAAEASRNTGVPVIAFSSDVARAARGTYLLAFTPAADIRRTLSYAAGQGVRRVVAFLPRDAYGRLAEPVAAEALRRGGASLVQTVGYERTGASIEAAAESSLAAVATADALYIPDGGAVPTAILDALKRAGATLEGRRILGSGQWETARLSSPLLRGAVFAGPDKSGFARFADRYRSTYARQPSTIAANAYDAVAFAASLVDRDGEDPFTLAAIENASGHRGIHGGFRFPATGVAERALAIYRVENGRAALVGRGTTPSN